MILYGSLYPFAFRIPLGGIGPVSTLLDSWANTPGRGDFLANILLYTPLGFFGRHALHRNIRAWRQTIQVVLFGAALSLGVELTQYYDVGRETAASDLYSNILGTLVGAVGARAIGTDLIRWSLARGKDNRVPLMLMASWIGYCLFPFVPTIDLHKYWNALKPVILHPSWTEYDLFHQTITWLTVAILIEHIFGHRKSLRVFPVFAGFILISKVLIIDQVLSVDEIAGAGLAVCLWFLLTFDAKMRLAVLAALLSFAVPISRLAPFDFGGPLREFGWIPFYSLMHGSVSIDTLSFFEKFFQYGSLIWILSEAGFRVRSATLFVATILLVTSWAECFLPDRSAEVTDALMALMIGGVIALIRATWSSARKQTVAADRQRRGYRSGRFLAVGPAVRNAPPPRSRPREILATGSSHAYAGRERRRMTPALQTPALQAGNDDNRFGDRSGEVGATRTIEPRERRKAQRSA